MKLTKKGYGDNPSEGNERILRDKSEEPAHNEENEWINSGSSIVKPE